MAEGGGGGKRRKLTVEVCNARNLMPKDGQGTASAYVVVDFDGQRRRTMTRFGDLNPQWDEKLEFLVHDPEAMQSETLEINVYNDKKSGRGTTFLGKVRISGLTFARAGAEALVYYPLEKRSVFSQIKGEIGLRIWFVDETTPGGGEAVTDKRQEEVKKPEGKAEKTKGEVTPEKSNEQAKEKESAAAAPAAAAPALALSSPAKVSTSRTGELGVRTQWTADRTGNSYDLVEKIPYLFVRLVKAGRSSESERSVFGKVSIGTHSVRTRSVQNNSDWDQVFAFHKASLNSTALDVSVWVERKKKKKEEDEELEEAAAAADSCMGVVSFDVQDIPKRSPPDSPLAPQWYTLDGESSATEDVMLATWVGTQVDEAFAEAWQSDSGGCNSHTRSKAYLSPKLWYLRATILQTQDLRFPAAAAARELSVKAQLGRQIFKTAKAVAATSSNGGTAWNEDLVFIAAEPFDPFLLITVEDWGKPVGHAKVRVSGIQRWTDDHRSEPPSRWFNLATDDAARPYAGRIHVRVCLEGGYHVLDEAAHVRSDVRAASTQLSKPRMGILDVAVRGATGLLPVKPTASEGCSGGTTDAYAVLKYGTKWARTRTLVGQFNPRWNEQYAWDVYDPCTVLTVAVFDNGRHTGKAQAKDARIGKVRIRLSTLHTNTVYLNSYPLTLLQPSGAKKMGEIELTIRFTCPSWINLVHSYASPLLPSMHYLRPLGPAQQDLLRHTAVRIVSSRLARSEPPLGPEVVQYLLDTDAHAWSMRRSKANWLRLLACLSFLVGTARWVHSLRTWQQPTTTVLVHFLLAALLFCPNLLLPSLFIYLFSILMWRYRLRPRAPVVALDPRLSCVDLVGPDELDEEFDTYPSSRSADEVRARYDKLRALAGKAQLLLGDVAAQGERVQALMGWKDPRATGIFATFCLIAAVIFYAAPLPIMLLAMAMYYLRHPRFRGELPPPPVNFFRRLPSLADRIL